MVWTRMSAILVTLREQDRCIRWQIWRHFARLCVSTFTSIEQSLHHTNDIYRERCDRPTRLEFRILDWRFPISYSPIHISNWYSPWACIATSLPWGICYDYGQAVGVLHCWLERFFPSLTFVLVHSSPRGSFDVSGLGLVVAACLCLRSFPSKFDSCSSWYMYYVFVVQTSRVVPSVVVGCS